MTQLLNVSRAARLAGVSRSEIQQKIQSGDLVTFEGEVKITDLLRVYPEINLDHDPTIEQLENIKSNSRPKFPWEESEPPSAEILMRRLQSLSGLIVETKARLDRQLELGGEVAARLDKLSADGGVSTDMREELAALKTLLTENAENGDAAPDDEAILFTRNMLLNIIAPAVQIIPSGHEYLAEGGDTVLDGAIKSGLNVQHGCTDGTCGGCKARVVSGQVLQTRTPGYELSDHEKRMGYMLMCCNAAVTDLVVEASETVSPTDLPEQSVECMIADMKPLTEEAHLLRLKAAEGQNFRFFAGQRATLTSLDGDAATLPIFSCPCDRESLHFVVKNQAHDTGAAALFTGLDKGEGVTLTGPEGEFVLADNSANPSLFITAGDGFLPVRSLIEHAISIDRIETYHVYRFADAASPALYHNLCRSWNDALDNFEYQNFEPVKEGDGFDVEAALGGLGRLEGFDAYVAGPKDFTEAVSAELTKRGLPGNRLSIEII